MQRDKGTMAELKVYLPDELDKRFRRVAMETYGYSHGSLSKAASEALTDWCSKHENSNNPVPDRSREHQTAKEASRIPESPLSDAQELGDRQPKSSASPA